jgi:transcriptional regulator
MYLPVHFEERRATVLLRLVREHPLGLLVTLSAAKPPATASDGFAGGSPHPVANPIPWRWRTSPDARSPDVEDADAPLEPHAGTLVAHVARANPVWRDTLPGSEALVVFQGPQAYVSPSAYPSKLAHGKVVPTWNYIVAQARGHLVVHDDREWKHALVGDLTAQHEAGRDRPWAVGDAPADYLETMLKAIVGLELRVTAWTGKWKLSQNRGAEDRAGVAADFSARGGEAAEAARWMHDRTG